MSSNVSHEVKGTVPQFAILDEHLDMEFGPGVWIMILSMLGFLIGAILIIIALMNSDDEVLHTGLIILAISAAGIALGIGITYLKEKSKPKNLTRVMHGLKLEDSPLSYQENEENIIDILKQNRWKFRIIK